MTEPKSTPAPFQPNPTRWLARMNAIEILGTLLGLAACAYGWMGAVVGVPMVLASLYSAFYIPPKINRGLYIGKCPHCGAEASATHYQTHIDCPSCGEDIEVKEQRFIAMPKKGKAA